MDSLRLLLFFSLSQAVTTKSYKMCSYTPKMKDPTLSYFNLSDGYDIAWSHAANSISKLDKALAGESKMIEADVQMRHNRSDTVPIMAHPPDTDSNLTLAVFLDKVTSSRKGVKLDFKSIIAVEPALQLLKNISDSKDVNNPVWLNADILNGPCFDEVCIPVDPTRFLELCQQYFPSAVLSIGWTTGHEIKEARNRYTWSQVIEMGKYISSISQPVTFPVRAALVKRSLPQLLWLVDLSRNLTLTVWSSERDDVNSQDLLELRSKVYDKKNVYYDLPEMQAKDFANALKDKKYIAPNNPYQDFHQIKMKLYSPAFCTDVLFGETKVMFTGKGGWVSSVDEIKAQHLESRFISMEVSFLSLDSQNGTQNFTVIAASNGLFGANSDLPQRDGVRLILQNTGEFQVIGPDGKIIKSSGRVYDPKSQYKIDLWYGASFSYIMFTVSSKADYKKSKFIKYNVEASLPKRYIVFGVEENQPNSAVLVESISTVIAVPGSSAGSWITPVNSVIILIAVLLVIFMYPY